MQHTTGMEAMLSVHRLGPAHVNSYMGHQHLSVQESPGQWSVKAVKWSKTG